MSELLITVGIILAVGIAALSLPMILDNSHCVATVNGEEWYNGPAYALECKSQGMATQCTAGYLIANKHIISEHIEVNCK